MRDLWLYINNITGKIRKKIIAPRPADFKFFFDPQKWPKKAKVGVRGRKNFFCSKHYKNVILDSFDYFYEKIFFSKIEKNLNL